MDSTQHGIVWKQIAEAPTGYMVSNTGDIKVVYADGQFEMLRKQKSSNFMYFYIVGTRHRIDETVGKAFVENPHGYKQIIHKDGDPTNNHAENLEWSSPAEIIIAKYRQHKLQGILCQCKETGAVYNTVLTASVMTGIPEFAIKNSIQTGRCCFGYHFVEVEHATNAQYISAKDVIDQMETFSDIEAFRKSIEAK